MPASTKALSRRVRNRSITAFGEKPRKKAELTESEHRLYGELSRYIPDYRKLPIDDPYRLEIERTLANKPEPPKKVVGAAKY